jgi:L-asparaginase
MSSKRAVHVLFTGGTISMRIDPGTGAAVPAMTGSEIVARVQGLRKEARLSLEDYARLPGPHVTPDWMWRLRGHVASLLANAALDGIVIAHGTDTLEETALLLDLTLDSPKPVVLCGAMRTVSEPGWDGPGNLTAAVRTAVHPESAGRGVLIAMGEEVHAAAEATKRHTQSLRAFHSAHGPLALVERGEVVYRRPPFPSQTLRPSRIVPAVDLHVMAAGLDDALIRASVARGARGIVLEATGCGNVPPAVLPGLREALAAGLPVVLTSRCPEGPVVPVYGYEGGGRTLRDLGIVFASELTGPKARIKLMLALGVTSELEQIRTLFDGQAAAGGR